MKQSYISKIMAKNSTHSRLKRINICVKTCTVVGFVDELTVYCIFIKTLGRKAQDGIGT